MLVIHVAIHTQGQQCVGLVLISMHKIAGNFPKCSHPSIQAYQKHLSTTIEYDKHKKDDELKKKQLLSSCAVSFRRKRFQSEVDFL